MTALPATSPPTTAIDGQKVALCFLADAEADFRQDLSKLLRGLGVETVEFSDSRRLIENVAEQNPDIIFINLNPAAPYDCVRAVLSLRECNYTGQVQLIGRCSIVFLENFRKIGSDAALNMLPVLQKPIEHATVRQIILEQSLGGAPVPPSKLSLAEALANDWIEFWYQPKIDFKTAQVVGAEAVARFSHPQYGILAPGRFLSGAADTDLIELTRRALLNAIATSVRFDKVGLQLKIAINISVETLVKLPVAELIVKHRPQHDQWPGLIFDVTERQVINEIALLKSRFHELEKYAVTLAIDDFGRGNSSFTIFKHLPCAEIKIDRSFVNGCASNKNNARICQTMIQLAHNFDSKAVAVGIETDADAKALIGMGCDIGQGFLFGKPMPERDFLGVIRQGKIVLL
jgi:EAL domain-containing protein (putative c-di-GMP-specific phosphodiesterase class I)/CheY-like chemotaxis protein